MASTLDPFVAVNSTTSIDVSNATKTEIQQTFPGYSAVELTRILHIVIRPVLIVFGTIGNGLSFYIMRQGSLKKMSTCFYLSILAIADTSKCLVSLYHETRFIEEDVNLFLFINTGSD